MADILESAGFFLPALIYPLVSGPAAAYVYVRLNSRVRSWSLPAFWFVLIIIHVAGATSIIKSSDALYTQGFFSCLLLPVFAAGTALALRFSSWRAAQYHSGHTDSDVRMGTSVLLIPLLQLAAGFLAAVLAPSF